MKLSNQLLFLNNIRNKNYKQLIICGKWTMSMPYLYYKTIPFSLFSLEIINIY